MKLSITICLILIICLATFSSNAQPNPVSIKCNTVFFELLGNGGFYSINYDRILLNKANWKLAGRAGASYFNFLSDSKTQHIATPFEFSYLRGKGNHFLEIGLGITPFYITYNNIEEETNKEKQLDIMSMARIGYRYQKKEGGVFYKVGWVPGYGKINYLGKRSYPNSSYTTPYMFGLAIGYTVE